MKGKVIIVIVIVVLVLAYYYYFIRERMFTEDDAKKAILNVKEKYGIDMARLIEKMMRLETAHFTSRQYIKTGSAGMEVGKWTNLPYKMGSVAMDDTLKPGMEKFLVWRNVTDFATYLADYIIRYNGNFARWNSTDAAVQAEYRSRVNTIRTKFV